MHKDKKPKNLNELLQTTRFTEDEIIAWYKNFLQVNVRGTYSACLREHNVAGIIEPVIKGPMNVVLFNMLTEWVKFNLFDIAQNNTRRVF